MSTAPNIDLTKILDEVEAELMAHVQTNLAKARPGESTTGEDESDSSGTDPSGDNASAASASPDPASASPDASGSDSPPPGDDASASAPPPGDDGSAPPPAASASPDGSPTGDPAMDQGPIDPQALMAEYAKLSLEDQKVHLMALKQVLMQSLAAAGGDDGSAAPPPAAPPPDASASAAPPPAPPPAASASAPAPALKAEIPSGDKLKSPGPPSGENPLHKSEQATLNAAIEAKVQEAVAPLVKAVKFVLEAPLRKSVVATADLPKAAPQVDVSTMSREQVRAKLGEKVRAGTLSKSEKDLVIQFDTGKVKVDQIAHLLK